jgi:hypothetical protein
MGKRIGPSNNFFIDRISLGVVTTSTVDTTWTFVACKLGQIRKAADSNSHTSTHPTKLGMEGMLLDGYGNGGLTKGIAMEQLLAVAPREYFLLCMPQKVEQKMIFYWKQSASSTVDTTSSFLYT